MTLSDEAVERAARALGFALRSEVEFDVRADDISPAEHSRIARRTLEASGLVDQSERIKELEDRLATAREVICRSAYFVEALADNDPDEPIADNGMTVLGKLQYDAPALALSLRATLDAIKEKNGA